jgi:hypothetical protein
VIAKEFKCKALVFNNSFEEDVLGLYISFLRILIEMFMIMSNIMMSLGLGIPYGKPEKLTECLGAKEDVELLWLLPFV